MKEYSILKMNTMRIYLQFSILIIGVIVSASCSKMQWTTTREGFYFYGTTKAHDTYSWTGRTFEGMIHGKGTMIIYDKNGEAVSRNDCVALYGATDVDLYSDTEYGKYLGAGKIKKGYKKPDGFGVLIVDSLYPKDSRALKRFKINDAWLDKHGELYIGDFKKGKFSGFGRLYAEEILEYEGYWKNGEKSSMGKEYKDGELVYRGSYKHGKRSGVGEEFAKNSETDALYTKYSGEWKDGKYDGYGSLYNEHILVYQGNWKGGKYNGRGKLYENGQCIEGRWESGINSRIYHKSIFDDVKTYFGQESDENVQQITDLQLADDEEEFITELSKEINSEIENTISANVDRRFGFWGVFRMYYQWIFTSDVKRVKKAERAFCHGLDPRKLTEEINAKIYHFNESNDADLNYIEELEKIPELSIVNTEVAMKILEREAMEVTDGLIGVLLDIIICLVIGFIIGFIIGLCIPVLIPYCAVIDTVLGVVSIIAGIIILFVYGSPVMDQMEIEIKQMLIYNFQLYLDSQNIFQQILL